MDATVLLLHGYEGNAPAHWQGWLARALAADGRDVRYPALPDPFHPRLEAWLAALDRELAAIGDRPLAVLGHSLGAILWLHHAARGGRAADRLLLVGAPERGWRHPDVHGLMPPPIVRGAGAREARVVCGDDDPYCSATETERYGADLGLPVDLVAGAGHLATRDGYGPWPSVLAWCRGATGPVRDRATTGP